MRGEHRQMEALTSIIDGYGCDWSTVTQIAKSSELR